MKAKKSLNAASVGLAVAGLVFFFLRPIVTMKFKGELYGDSGWDAIRGVEGADPTYMLLVPIVLAVIGVVAACIYEKTKDKRFALAATVAYFVAGALFLCSKNFYLAANEDTVIAFAKDAIKLGVGAIFAAIMMVLAAIFSGISVLKKS